jgi:hypothetical protein
MNDSTTVSRQVDEEHRFMEQNENVMNEGNHKSADLEMTSSETIAEEDTSIDTVTKTDSVASVKCTSETYISSLPGFCPVENQIKALGDDSSADCNYLVVEPSSNGTARYPHKLAYSAYLKHEKLLRETNCNIFVTQLCSKEESSYARQSNDQNDSDGKKNSRFNVLDDVCLEPTKIDVTTKDVETTVVDERRKLLFQKIAAKLPPIDLLYIHMPNELNQIELIQSFITMQKLKPIQQSSTIEDTVVSPMQLVFSNVAQLNTVREAVHSKALSSGLIVVDSHKNYAHQHSTSLTMVRFQCSVPKVVPMGGSANFVGAGFPM